MPILTTLLESVASLALRRRGLASKKIATGSGRLRVFGVFVEDGVRRTDDMLGALAGELRRLAGWLRLSEISVEADTPAAVTLRRALTVVDDDSKSNDFLHSPLSTE